MNFFLFSPPGTWLQWRCCCCSSSFQRGDIEVVVCVVVVVVVAIVFVFVFSVVNVVTAVNVFVVLFVGGIVVEKKNETREVKNS